MFILAEDMRLFNLFNISLKQLIILECYYFDFLHFLKNSTIFDQNSTFCCHAEDSCRHAGSSRSNNPGTESHQNSNSSFKYPAYATHWDIDLSKSQHENPDQDSHNAKNYNSFDEVIGKGMTCILNTWFRIALDILNIIDSSAYLDNFRLLEDILD